MEKALDALTALMDLIDIAEHAESMEVAKKVLSRRYEVLRRKGIDIEAPVKNQPALN